MADSSDKPALRAGSEDGVIFRAADPSDESAIREILLESKLPLHAIRQPVNPDLHSPHLPSPHLHSIAGAYTHLCEARGEIVAVLQWHDLGGEAEILNLAVSAKHRRGGFGRALLANFLQIARQRRVDKVFLEVRESNSPALALYDSQGFERSGRRLSYYHDPEEAALLLEIKLTA